MQVQGNLSRRRKTSTMGYQTALGTPSPTKSWTSSPMPRAEMNGFLGLAWRHGSLHVTPPSLSFPPPKWDCMEGQGR